MKKYIRLRFLQFSPSLKFILLLSLCLNTIGIWWGLLPGSPVDWGSDTISPNEVIEASRQMFSDGWHSRYPPFHYQVLSVLYSPFFLLHAAGLLDIQSQSIYLFLFYIGRVFSLLMSNAIIILVYQLAKELKLSNNTAILSTVIVILNPLFIYYSKTTNLEIPYITWLLVSNVYALRVYNNHKISDLTYFSIFATLAICTKDQAYGFFVLLIPFLFYSQWSYYRKDTSGGWATLLYTLKTSFLPILVAVILFVTIYNFPFNFQGFVSHIQLIVGPASTEYRIFPNSVTGHVEMGIQSIRQAIFTQGWPLFLVSVIGAITAIRQRKINPVIIIPFISVISYYIFFISVIGYNYDRFFLPIIILLSPFSGSWIGKLLNTENIPVFLKNIVVYGALAYSFLYAASVDTLLIADSRYKAREWMTDNIEISDKLYGIGKPYYLPPIFTYQEKQFVTQPNLQKLATYSPDYIITSSIYNIDIFPIGSDEYIFFKSLQEGTTGYELVFQYQGIPLFNILKRDNVITNLDKVNPDIQIYRTSSIE